MRLKKLQDVLLNHNWTYSCSGHHYCSEIGETKVNSLDGRDDHLLCDTGCPWEVLQKVASNGSKDTPVDVQLVHATLGWVEYRAFV